MADGMTTGDGAGTRQAAQPLTLHSKHTALRPLTLSLSLTLTTESLTDSDCE